eukprot:15254-Eustigmatos_ZCMA.PRE.1
MEVLPRCRAAQRYELLEQFCPTNSSTSTSEPPPEEPPSFSRGPYGHGVSGDHDSRSHKGFHRCRSATGLLTV